MSDESSGRIPTGSRESCSGQSLVTETVAFIGKTHADSFLGRDLLCSKAGQSACRGRVPCQQVQVEVGGGLHRPGRLSNESVSPGQLSSILAATNHLARSTSIPPFSVTDSFG